LRLALATDRLRPRGEHRLLDGVDDGADLSLVRAGRDEEDVGEHQLLADVEGDDLLRLAAGRGTSRGDGQLDRTVRGRHRGPPSCISVTGADASSVPKSSVSGP